MYGNKYRVFIDVKNEHVVPRKQNTFDICGTVWGDKARCVFSSDEEISFSALE